MSLKKSDSAGRKCLCSPTNHPGSFRCSFHRGSNRKLGGGRSTAGRINRLGDYASKWGLVKAFLMQIIKPSSHDQQRRRNFQPKPTRFCVVNKNNSASNSGNQVAVS